MKPKKIEKKLALNKETMKNLDDSQMQAVQAGMTIKVTVEFGGCSHLVC